MLNTLARVIPVDWHGATQAGASALTRAIPVDWHGATQAGASALTRAIPVDWHGATQAGASALTRAIPVDWHGATQAGAVALGIIMQGIMTALITPFYKGKVDDESLRRLVQQQLQAGVRAFVINGTTGESPTLTVKEVEHIFRAVADCTRKRTSQDDVKLILGAGLNSTQKTLNLIKSLAHLQPDAWLSVVPYYNKPPQQGLIEHFKALAQDVENLILYNVPGRTIVGLDNTTILQLSQVPHITGIKEASGNIKVLNTLQSQTPKNFYWLSGDDASCMHFMAAGGRGVISVLSNILPGPMVDMFNSLQEGRTKTVANSSDAQATPNEHQPNKAAPENSNMQQVVNEYKKYDTLNMLMGIEANPIPVKMALYLMGVIRSPELRLPLVPLSSNATSQLERELAKLSLDKTLS